MAGIGWPEKWLGMSGRGWRCWGIGSGWWEGAASKIRPLVQGSWSKNFGPWSMGHGPRTMGHGPITMVHGLWSKDHGPGTMVQLPWSMVNGSWIMVQGPWSMDYGPSTMVHGPWIMAQRPWSKDYGLNTIVHGPRIMIQVRWIKDYGPSTMVHPCTDHGPMTMAAASPKPRETDLGSVWVPILCLSSLDLLMLSRCRKGRLGEGRSWEAAVPPTKKTTQIKNPLVFSAKYSHLFSAAAR